MGWPVGQKKRKSRPVRSRAAKSDYSNRAAPTISIDAEAEAATKSVSRSDRGACSSTLRKELRSVAADVVDWIGFSVRGTSLGLLTTRAINSPALLPNASASTVAITSVHPNELMSSARRFLSTAGAKSHVAACCIGWHPLPAQSGLTQVKNGSSLVGVKKPPRG